MTAKPESKGLHDRGMNMRVGAETEVRDDVHQFGIFALTRARYSTTLANEERSGGVPPLRYSCFWADAGWVTQETSCVTLWKTLGDPKENRRDPVEIPA